MKPFSRFIQTVDIFGAQSVSGPLTEVHLPVDSLTKNVKGFGFVTFMIPEHAVKAFTELDGTVFQVRYPVDSRVV